MVSYRVSPFTTDEVETSPRLMTSPPSRFIAVSNDIRVRVEGSKNRFPSIFPCRSGRYSCPLAAGRSRAASSRIARISSFFAVIVAGYFGINPPGFVAAVVALAFGLAAASFFPAIILGIFSKRVNKEGAISGMVVGISMMLYYMAKFKLGWLGPIPPSSEWWFGISPEGFGSIAMLCNFLVSITVSYLTPPPSSKVTQLVDDIRIPEN